MLPACPLLLDDQACTPLLVDGKAVNSLLLPAAFFDGRSDSLRRLGFEEPTDVRSRYGIGSLIADRRKRQGVYLLVLEGGHFYIGRATDVVQRFAQHRKTFGARLIGFAFQQAPLAKHVDLEKSLIQRAERAGLPLEQIEWVSQSYSTSDLDELVSPTEYAAWAADPVAHLSGETWPLPEPKPGRAGRDADVYGKFRRSPLSPVAVDLLSLYVQHCVPLPRRTAPDYWNVACLPSTNASSYPRLVCVSAHVMETFVVGHEAGEHDAFWGFVVCARTPLIEAFGSLTKAARAIRGIDIDADRNYKSAGEDQCRISFDNPSVAAHFMRLRVIQDAARTLMHRAMRKGVNRYARYHCAPLAEAALQCLTR